jgi:HPt (histidine-containing phosphotransfer) domain-containing protein
MLNGTVLDEHTHVDRQKSLQWLEGDERMLEKIKSIFMKNIPSQVELLRRSLDSDNTVSAERMAHTIMGSSAMMGASAMSDEARKIELSAMEGDMDSARFHFSSFLKEYAMVMDELEVVADGEQA